MTSKIKVQKIRELMQQNNIDTYIITKFDPHLSEYTTPHYDTVKFISNFTGSNGTIVITKDTAGLWTDGRYFIQAEKELDANTFTLFKQGLPDTISFLDFANKNTPNSGTIGINGESIPAANINSLYEKNNNKKINININFDFVSQIWTNRPKINSNKVFEHAIQFSGKTRKEKIAEIQNELKEKNCYLTVVNILEDIAWIYNLRGSDGYNTPTFNAYTVISQDEAILFIDDFKIADVKDSLNSDNIKIMSYNEIYNYLKSLDNDKNIYIKNTSLNYKLLEAIKHTKTINFDSNISENLKALKNQTEITNIEKAYTRDCISLVRSIKYIKENAHTETITETYVDELLTKNRSAMENYLTPSFDTIAGYNENGAMLHYKATEKNQATIKNYGFLLIDSGAQYLDGTTDITRTISLGNLTEEMKKDFTLTLKSMIAVSNARFLKGTCGNAIDILARQPMWNNGLDYKCGTGHGLGYCLNVHEGPQGISSRNKNVEFKVGMVLTNEPGVYKENKYGIRTENTLVVTEDLKTDIDTFFKFKTLSFFPIDVDAIDKSLLTSEEVLWVNEYHKETYNRLSPFLNEDEKKWLKKETREI